MYIYLQGPAINNDDLFVAVKTCEQYHKDRGKWSSLYKGREGATKQLQIRFLGGGGVSAKKYSDLSIKCLNECRLGKWSWTET